MRCANCDDELPPGAEFCIECGQRAPASRSSAGKRTQRMLHATDAAGWPPTAAEAAPQPLQRYAPAPVAPHAAQTSTLATISLVFGALGWVGLPLIGAVVAVITGHLALQEIRVAQRQVGGKALATAGLALGYANLAFALVLLVVYVAVRGTVSIGL